jgi:hypothetical protein
MTTPRLLLSTAVTLFLFTRVNQLFNALTVGRPMQMKAWPTKSVRHVPSAWLESRPWVSLQVKTLPRHSEERKIENSESCPFYLRILVLNRHYC